MLPETWGQEEAGILKVEQSTFTPLIVSATGEMAKQSTTFYKRLAPSLLTNGNTPTAQPSPGYDASSHSPSWVLPSNVSEVHAPPVTTLPGSPLPIDLVTAEAHLSSGH